MTATLVLLHDDWLTWFGVNGFLRMETMRKVIGQGIKPSIFLILPWNDSWIPAFYWIFLLFAVFLTVGLFSRVSSVAVFVCLVSIQVRNVYIFHSGDKLLLCSGFFLMFAPTGAALSLDRLWRIWRGKEGLEIQPCRPWAQRMIQIQLALVYIGTFLWKVRGAAWVSGTAVYYTTRSMEFQRFPMPILEDGPALRFMTWSALGVEGCFGVLVWIRKIRYWVLLAGIGLHLSLEYSMNVPLFQWITMSIYVTFIDPADLTRVRNWLRRHLPGKPVNVTYDGSSARGAAWANVMRAVDVFGRLNLVDLSVSEISKTGEAIEPSHAGR